jgi:hypothetical protein
MAPQQRLFACCAAVLPNRNGVMPGQGALRIALADQPPMNGDRGILATNMDFGGKLVDGDRLADEPFGDGIAVGIDRDIAVQIDDTFQQLVDRRQRVGQRFR